MCKYKSWFPIIWDIITWIQIISSKFAGIGFKKPPFKENILTYPREDTVCEIEMKNIFLVRPIELEIQFENSMLLTSIFHCTKPDSLKCVRSPLTPDKKQCNFFLHTHTTTVEVRIVKPSILWILIVNTCLSKVEYLGISSFPERNTSFLFSVSTVLEKCFEILIFRSRNKSKVNVNNQKILQTRKKLCNHHKSPCQLSAGAEREDSAFLWAGCWRTSFPSAFCSRYAKWNPGNQFLICSSLYAEV